MMERWDAGLLECLDGLAGCRGEDEWDHGIIGAWDHLIMGSWVHGIMGSWTTGSSDHGMKVSRGHGIMGSWDRRTREPWDHGIMGVRG